MQAALVAFSLSYVASIVAGVTMIVYARSVWARGDTANPLTPGIMIVANLLKTPLTVQEWNEKNTPYTKILLANVLIANAIWVIAFYYSI